MQFGLKSMSPVSPGWKFRNSLVRVAVLALPLAACFSSAAHAQSGIPSVLPTDLGSSMPSPASSPALPTGQALITLNFKDVPVADLITMIAEQGNVSIIVASDVTDILRNVTLNDKTPDQAIQFVAETAGLAWRKLDARTYAIAKELKDLPGDRIPTGGAAAQSALPAGITPGVAPGITANVAQPSPSLELPQLYQGSTEREDPKIYSYLPLRNVTPRIMAWWLDPAHNPVPMQFKASEDTLRASSDRSIARPALAPNMMSAMNGGNFTPSANETYNPWTPAGSMSRSDADLYSGGMQSSDVYTQVSPQFGRGGTNQRGGNQRGNQRGGRGGAAGGAGVFELPEGIDSLVAVDPQNALLVRGRPDSIAQLEEIIALLDKPLRQVEIEAQFVTVGTQDTKAFGIDFQSANGPFRLNTTGRAPTATNGTFSLGYVRNNFRATLNALEQQGKTKTVSSPRVTAINNLTASLTSSTATPLILTTVAQNISGNQQSAQQLIYITTNVGLSVTPTINNDDTITVVMQPEVSTQVPNTDTGLPTILQNRIETIANVKDGDTIALGGLRTKSLSDSKSGVPIIRNIPIIGRLFESKNKLDSESELIIFLTARIIRRVDDPVPGT